MFEKEVLSCLLVKPDRYFLICDLISQEHFLNPVAQAIATCIWESRGDYDRAKIRTQAKARFEVKAEDFVSFLNYAGTPDNLHLNATRLRDIWLREREVELLENTAAKLRDVSVETGISLGEMDAERRKLEGEADEDDSVQGYLKILQEVSEARKENRAFTGIDTGYSEINKLTGGWRPGKVVVIGARPGMGKTTFVQNLLVYAAQNGVKCALYSLEMDSQEIRYRILSQLTGVTVLDLQSGRVTPTEQDKMLGKSELAASLPIQIESRKSKLHSITDHVRKLARQGVKLVAIDYLQLVNPGNSRGTRNDEVALISRELKTLSTETGVTLFVLSQLSRDAEKRGGKRYRNSDLRDSGAIEQDADIIIFIHRLIESDEVELQMTKNRNGRLGDINLFFPHPFTEFTEFPKTSPSIDYSQVKRYEEDFNVEIKETFPASKVSEIPYDLSDANF